MRIKINEATIGIFGGKRTGKTYYTRKLVEGLKTKVIVWDTIGAIKPKRFANYVVNPGNLEKDAAAWGILMLETKTKGISINMAKLTQEEIVEFTDISLKIGAEGIRNKVVVVDEAAELLPQQYRQSREMQRLIRHGGNVGNTFVFNSQRPAYISKNTLNLVDILIVFRTVFPRDIETLREILADTGKANLDDTIAVIKNLKVGEYSFFNFRG